MAPPPPVLMDELIEEILLHFPPDHPASLVRAGLVCRSWQRIVSDPSFARRFREFHFKLGFFYNFKDDQTGADIVRFVPTSTCPALADRRNSRALDARHGRVLLHDTTQAAPPPPGPPGRLVVWDPVTDEQRDLPLPPGHLYRNCTAWNAAVLCAAVADGGGACDHLGCHGGPFLIVLSCIVGDAAYFFLYSSITGSWSKPSEVVYLNQYPGAARDVVGPSLLIGGTLHFLAGHEILTYDLAGNNKQPWLFTSPFSGMRNMALVATTEEGDGRGGLGLGAAVVREGSVRLYSNLHGLAGWKEEKGGFIGLEAGANTLVAFAEGLDAVLVITEKGGISMHELKSGRITEVCETGLHCDGAIVPYVRFCLPGSSTGPHSSQPAKMNLGN
ncbi:unnamed protein product [Urochloa decumbens]|uniref:F-box domain-containing protein n=1 Tax=Urochloa decumbens TaxID=240449 RepID=A0ABC9H387_9POAL